MAANGNGDIIPGVRYKNAPAAIEYLCKTFGFTEHLVVPGDNGTIVHAQLRLGTGMIMLGTARDDEYGKLVSVPADIGTTTQAAYVVVDAIDDHYEHAVAAGADIVLALAEQDHGGKLYTARDPEGHIWNFGSYDPFA